MLGYHALGVSATVATQNQPERFRLILRLPHPQCLRPPCHNIGTDPKSTQSQHCNTLSVSAPVATVDDCGISAVGISRLQHPQCLRPRCHSDQHGKTSHFDPHCNTL